jgi:hypothetical protein
MHIWKINKIINSFRNSLILFLAGDRSVIVNAHFIGFVKIAANSFVANVTIEGIKHNDNH